MQALARLLFLLGAAAGAAPEAKGGARPATKQLSAAHLGARSHTKAIRITKQADLDALDAAEKSVDRLVAASAPVAVKPAAQKPAKAPAPPVRAAAKARKPSHP